MRSLYSKNIGYGPAMNIVFVIIQSGGLMKGVRPNEPLPLRTLGPRQKTYAYGATQPPNDSVSIIDDPDLNVLIEYDDILGNHYQTQYMNRKHSINQIARREYPSEQASQI
jgi:hypothetical protein